MELKENLKQANLNFYQQLSHKTRGLFVQTYSCEMKCYESADDLENADKCAENCRKDSYILRETLQVQYSSAFVSFT